MLGDNFVMLHVRSCRQDMAQVREGGIGLNHLKKGQWRRGEARELLLLLYLEQHFSGATTIGGKKP